MTAMEHLDRTALAGLHPDRCPLVDPRDLRPRIIHIGLGAFHRAHQAVYTEAAAARTGEPWGIVAVAPRSSVAPMLAQDCLYSVTDLAPGAGTTRVVGAVVEALEMRPDAGRLTELLRSPEVTTVTLTVTEKGYSRRTGGGLDTAAAGVVADLAATASAEPDLVTVVGRLSAGLAERFRAGGAPIDVVSCDNTAANGAALARVVREFVAASAWRDRDAVLDWLATSAGARTRSSTGSSRPPRTGTATPRPPRSACATRWPSSASPTGSGCSRTASSQPGRSGSSTGRSSSRTSRPTS